MTPEAQASINYKVDELAYAGGRRGERWTPGLKPEAFEDDILPSHKELKDGGCVLPADCCHCLRRDS